MKKILAILLALTMVLALAVPTFADTELVTKNFTISYKATYTENDWNSTPAIDKSTLTGSIVGGRAELIDVLSPILLMTDLSSITKITVVPSLSDSSDWARQSDRMGGAAGTYVAPGASLYVNSDWDSMTTDYNLNEGSDEFVVTDGFGTMSKLQFEVFGANPYSDGPITVTLEVSVTYNASSAEPNSVVISGTTYNEDVIFDSTFTADAGAWSWNAPLNGDSTPSVKSIFNLAKISPDDVYIKIIASNSTTKVMIQASPGTNGVNTPTYKITDGDNVISYYRAMDVLNAYVNGVEGASADDSFWSLVIQPVVDTVFSDLDIVRLLEVYTVTVTNGTADKGVAIEGETVTVTPNEAQSGKVFNKWIVEGLDEDDYDVDENNVLTFNMPANDVTLNATYRNLSDLPIGFDLPVIGKTPDTTLDPVSYTHLPSPRDS